MQRKDVSDGLAFNGARPAGAMHGAKTMTGKASLCPKCGNPVRSDDRFCGSCGEPLAAAPAVDTVTGAAAGDVPVRLRCAAMTLAWAVSWAVGGLLYGLVHGSPGYAGDLAVCWFLGGAFAGVSLMGMVPPHRESAAFPLLAGVSAGWFAVLFAGNWVVMAAMSFYLEFPLPEMLQILVYVLVAAAAGGWVGRRLMRSCPDMRRAAVLRGAIGWAIGALVAGVVFYARGLLG